MAHSVGSASEETERSSLSSTERNLFSDKFKKDEQQQRRKLYRIEPNTVERFDKRMRDVREKVKEYPKLYLVSHRQQAYWKWQVGGYKEELVAVYTSRNVSSRHRRITMLRLHQSIQSYFEVNENRLRQMAGDVEINAAQIEAVLHLPPPGDIFEGVGESGKKARHGNSKRPMALLAILKSLSIKLKRGVKVGVVQLGALNEAAEGGQEWVIPGIPLLAVAVDTRLQIIIAAHEAQMIQGKQERARERRGSKEKAKATLAESEPKVGQASSSRGQNITNFQQYRKSLIEAAHAQSRGGEQGDKRQSKRLVDVSYDIASMGQLAQDWLEANLPPSDKEIQESESDGERE